jgi:hypothetical protein
MGGGDEPFRIQPMLNSEEDHNRNPLAQRVIRDEGVMNVMVG